MFDESLLKDLIEMYGKCLSYKDIEAIGSYLFKDRGYDLHAVAGTEAKMSISALNAAKVLVEDVEKKNRLKDLFAFTIELDGTTLNAKIVKLEGLENLLYRLSRTGQYYDFTKRKFVDTEDHHKLVNWGALRDGREYAFSIASVGRRVAP